MPEEEPKPSRESPTPVSGKGFSRDPADTGEDPVFADWSEMRLTRAVFYACGLLAAAAGVVLFLILLNVL